MSEFSSPSVGADDEVHMDMKKSFTNSKIVALALQMAPVQLVMEEIVKISHWPALISQGALYVLLHEVYSFPVSAKYLKYLSKCVSKAIEDSGSDFLDDLMALFVESQCKNNTVFASLEDCCYCGYLLPPLLANDSSKCEVAAIRVDRCNNQVGMKTWGAGVLLAELCFNLPEMFENLSVFELGAGVGITGVVASKCPRPPRRFVMSDYTPEIVENMAHNLTVNRRNCDTSVSSSQACCDLSSCVLDWFDVGTFSHGGPVQCSGGRKFLSTTTKVDFDFLTRDKTTSVEDSISGLDSDGDLETISCAISPFVSGSSAASTPCVPGAVDTIKLTMPRFDVLVAADCTYSEDICLNLLGTIEVFLQVCSFCDAESDAPKQKYALVLATRRQDKTFEYWQRITQSSATVDCHDVTAWVHRQTCPAGANSASAGSHSCNAIDGLMRPQLQFYCEFRELIFAFCLVLKGSGLPPIFNSPGDIDQVK